MRIRSLVVAICTLVHLIIAERCRSQSEQATISEVGKSEIEMTENSEYLVKDASPANLGVFPPNSKVSVEFEVMNRLPVEIEFLGSKTSCGCSKVNLEKTKIGSMDSVTCSLLIDAGSLETDRAIQVVQLFKRKDSETTAIFASRLFALKVRRPVSWSCDRSILISRREPTSISAKNYTGSPWTDVRVKCDSKFVAVNTELRHSGDDSVADTALISIRSNCPESEGFKEATELQLFTRCERSDVWVFQDKISITVSQPQLLRAAPARILYQSDKATHRVFVMSDDPSLQLAESEISLDGKSLRKKVISPRWLSLEVDSVCLKDRMDVELLIDCNNTKYSLKIPVTQ